MGHIRLTLGMFQGQITRTRSVCEGLWCEGQLWEGWEQWMVRTGLGGMMHTRS